MRVYMCLYSFGHETSARKIDPLENICTVLYILGTAKTLETTSAPLQPPPPGPQPICRTATLPFSDRYPRPWKGCVNPTLGYKGKNFPVVLKHRAEWLSCCASVVG